VPHSVPLQPEQLFSACDPAVFAFETTAELLERVEILGQPRAEDAVRFGVGIEQEGFNIYALGPVGTGKRHMVDHFLRECAARRPAAPDTCYVHNFEESHRARVLRVPAGKAVELQQAMADFVEAVRTSLARAMESEEYQARRRVLEQQFEERPEQAFDQLRAQARERGLAMLRTPVGIVFAPLKAEDEVMPPEEYKELPADERKQIEGAVEELQVEVQKVLRQAPAWEREMQAALRELNREMTTHAVGHLIEELRASFDELPQVLAFLDAVEKDIVEHAEDLLQVRTASDPAQLAAQVLAGGPTEPSPVLRYKVNVMVDHQGHEHAPVVCEEHPTYANLVGRVEHVAQMGALVTDFHLIRPGALHRANGGYLVLDARALLTQPYAWEALKRSLKTREVRIESLGQVLGVVSTVSLEPEPVPLQVKVVLLGEPLLYYLLCAYDPEFGELFKVAADFDDRLARSDGGEQQYARLVAGVVEHGGLRPFDRGAVARVVEHGSRLVGHAEKLSAHTESVADLVREADYWAGQEGLDVVGAVQVQRAVDAQVHRADRLRERVQESILRGTVFIDTDGARVGQINGLSVIQLGRFAFGQPNRITARVRLGKGEVVNIEREVELSGPIHSKGVLIMSSFLASRYAADEPLSLSASLVFEQSYAGVDGDSASCAELLALLSAIADCPLHQSLAITGSVNQHGLVQPIGGVNEKIEGYYDICAGRGLTGRQGVVIPRANVPHLMLRHDVVAAAKAGLFHVYAVETVDDAIELLTGQAAGAPDADGRYPDGTVNGAVERRLRDLARRRKEALAQRGEGDAS